MSISNNQPNKPWKDYEKILFRFFFIYFILQVVPLDWKYYAHIFSINWAHLQFSDIFYISRYTPQITGHYTAGVWGLNTLTDWGTIALLALIGTAIWSITDKKSQQYNQFYYWLRVLLRYRLAIGIIAYGFIKFFPLQGSYPSISNLNTSYGDFNRWKLFALSLGIVPGYETFLGLVEIIAGLLLLFRKTTTFGALIILLFTGNVFLSNLAYDGGEGFYSLYLVLIAVFLVWFDLQRLYILVGLRQPVQPNQLKPVYVHAWQKNGRLVIKGLVILFFIAVYGDKTYAAYTHGGYHYPQTKGLKGSAGLYNVSTFKWNNQEHPQSDTDSLRWQNVVFEKWSTISIKTFKKQVLDSVSTEEAPIKDFDRDYELAGSGGRSYYQYTVDTVSKVLHLTNKNKHYAADQLTLHYTQPDSSSFILSGVDQQKDSVYAVINKINKKYLLKEAAKGRSKAISKL